MLKFDESVTAVDFAPTLHGTNYVIAVGLDNGRIFIAHLQSTFEVLVALPFDPLFASNSSNVPGSHCSSICHMNTVRRLRFRPRTRSSEPLEVRRKH